MPPNSPEEAAELVEALLTRYGPLGRVGGRSVVPVAQLIVVGRDGMLCR